MQQFNAVRGKSYIWIIGALAVALAAGLLYWWFAFGPAEQPFAPKVVPTGNLAHQTALVDSEAVALQGAHSIAFRGGYAYITSLRDHGVQVFDVSDHGNPVPVASLYDGDDTLLKTSYDIAFSGNYAYVTSIGDRAIQVLNVSDPRNPVPVRAIAYAETIPGMVEPHAALVSGSYLYITDMQADGIGVLDISNPSNPVFAGSIFDSEETALGGAHEIRIVGNYAYVTSIEEGIQVLDVSNPGNPRPLTALFAAKNAAPRGSYSLVADGALLYVASREGGLWIYSISNPVNPIALGILAPTEENGMLGARSIDVVGHYAYVVSDVAGAGGSVAAIDVSNPSGPVAASVLFDDETTLFRGTHTIRALGEYIYVSAPAENAVSVFKISE